ncbi:hypothetical protein [Leptothermofonsia sp. ETS-13]|uniref:hypothetical protein n=1 Tax=Leptothermofonsia sp. ETS-13 TaxID=3035696 RepID=UPI003BA345B8
MEHANIVGIQRSPQGNFALALNFRLASKPHVGGIAIATRLSLGRGAGGEPLAEGEATTLP